MIQFQCDACEAFLRARDDKAGRRVRCPHCGAKVHVPDPDFSGEHSPPKDAAGELLGEVSGAGQGGDAWSEEMAVAEDLSDLVEPKTEWPAAPAPVEEAAGGASAEPDEEQKAENAEASTAETEQAARREYYLPKLDDPLRRKVFWPAVGVLTVTLASLLLSLLYIPIIAWQAYHVLNGTQGFDGCFVGALMFWTIISSLFYIVVLSRAIHMLLMTDHEQAMVSAGLVMLPCSLCCVVGIPVGLWAFTVLRDEDVKKAFKKRRAPS
jgi:DNA-directed RNA polymerase subunit RPC12/RpoP